MMPFLFIQGLMLIVLQKVFIIMVYQYFQDYARLYKDFATDLNLQVECVNCYCKGVGYEPGDKINKTNHEYNVINLDNNWYPIDSTWGSGHLEDRNFVKSYNEFYFLANPELLIKTHFPEDEKWQLTKKEIYFRRIFELAFS